MNYYKLYKKLRLDELGISSDEEAEELEFELELRFEEFTPKDRKTWLDQNAYLEHFSRTGTVTSAARRAGVTVYKAQRWKYDNVLGFTRRLEVATLVFKDRLKQKVLLRASDPKAPATLLIELLRAYIPEEFSRNGHKCDTSKADELLRRFREDARRELEAGHPTLRKIAEGATNAPPSDDREPSYSNLSPTPGDPHSRETHINPVHALQSLPRRGRDTERGCPAHGPTCPPTVTRRKRGLSTRANLAHPSFPRRNGNPQTVPSSPIGPSQTPNVTPSPDPHEGPHHHDYPPLDTAESNLSPAAGDPHNTNLSPAGGEIQRGGSSRAQRREQLRQQRKNEKKNTFPVVRF